MEQSEIFLVEQFLESQLFAQTFQDLVPGWTQPIVIGRHAFGDQYRATDFVVPGKGKLSMKWVSEDGSKEIEEDIYDFRRLVGLLWECIIMINLLKILQELVLITV